VSGMITAFIALSCVVLFAGIAVARTRAAKRARIDHLASSLSMQLAERRRVRARDAEWPLYCEAFSRRMRMTRDECLVAVGEAFDGAEVWAGIDSWTLTVESVPIRKIQLLPSFVKTHIDADGMSPAELTAMVSPQRAGAWQEVKGSFHLVLR